MTVCVYLIDISSVKRTAVVLQLCALRELYHGRFTDAEAAILLELNDGDVRKAAHMVHNSKYIDKWKQIEEGKLFL